MLKNNVAFALHILVGSLRSRTSSVESLSDVGMASDSSQGNFRSVVLCVQKKRAMVPLMNKLSDI